MKLRKALACSGVFKISNEITGKVLKNAVNQCCLKHFQSPSQTEGQTPQDDPTPPSQVDEQSPLPPDSKILPY